jgi:hypothetical protein
MTNLLLRPAVLAAGMALAAAGVGAAPAMADDTLGPTAGSLSIYQISNGDPGSVRQNSGSHFYVCANSVLDPSGVKSVTMNVSSIGLPSAYYDLTKKPMSNDFTWTSYCPPEAGTFWSNIWEGEWVTKSSLPESGNPYTYSITMTDNLGNTSSQSSTVNADNTPPKAVDVQTTNGGATPGKPEQGDQVTLTYSERLSRGIADETGRNVVVHIDNSGTNDILSVWSSSNKSQDAYEGSVKLGGDYVSANRTFGATGTPSRIVRSGNSLVVTLGTASGTTNTVTGPKTMVWTPSTSAYDAVCLHVLAGTVTESGTGDPDF